MKRCLQCGERLRKTEVFCDAHCRHRYNPKTWGKGRGNVTLTKLLKASLKKVKEGKRG